MICIVADGCSQKARVDSMGIILMVAGVVCIIASIIVFILYLTMGKAVGKKLMKQLKDEY